MEQGLSFRNTAIMVNEHRSGEGKLHIGRSNVRNISENESNHHEIKKRM